MAGFNRSDDLRGATFDDADLRETRFVDVTFRGARIVASDLSEVVMRGVVLEGVEIDAPWLLEGDDGLVVNGVDVAPFVDAELNRRFPGREQRCAGDPEALRTAWAVLQRSWSAALDRVAGMPAGTVDVSVGDEWSFAQTLRHLVLATDAWLGRAVLGLEHPFHPLGQPSGGEDDLDTSILTTGVVAYEDVLAARASRVSMVQDYLATATPEMLAEEHANPWNPEYPETTLDCLHTILEEEWEHLRYAVRDLDAIEAGKAG